MIPTESLDAIRARLDIVELVREFVPELKRAGRNMKARCPFHQERTASFVISPERQSFHCFGCGAGGDAFAFLMKMENLSFIEAAEKLAERLGIKLAPARESLGPAERERLKIKEVLEFARDFYHRALKAPEGAAGLRYLTQRGVSPESIEGFKLGFAPAGSPLVAEARRKGHPLELLRKAGLANEGGRDYFYNRVLYPISDARGAVVGFGARTLGDGQPKYLNSPDSPVFSKGRVLYGLFEGLAEIRKSRRALLMEGYMDVIMTHQHGLRLACAPLGTAVTDDQAAVLKRYASDATVVFDSDSAGFSAAIRGAERLLSVGLSVRIAAVPEGKDPDELLRKSGVQAFSRCLETAVDLAEFKTELEFRRRGEDLGPEQKSAVAREVLATIAQCPDEVLKAEWVRRLAQRLKISEESCWKAMGKGGENPVRRPAQAPATALGLPNDDEEILLHMLKAPGSAKRLEDGDLGSEIGIRIWKAALAARGEGAAWSAGLLEALDERDRVVASRLLVKELGPGDPKTILERILENRRAERRLRALEPLALANPNDVGLWRQYQEQFIKMKGTRR